MNKISLIFLCLVIVTIGVSCVAASDNATMFPDSIQTFDQQQIPVGADIDNGIADAPDNDTAPVDNCTFKGGVIYNHKNFTSLFNPIFINNSACHPDKVF